MGNSFEDELLYIKEVKGKINMINSETKNK
jgi:hypothetical protein